MESVNFVIVLNSAIYRLKKENNSWDILNAILGHKYHQNHSNWVISSK